ncbi:MAG: Rrf2 family transcriptional regulator [Alteromonadaceae bacterium]|nr:MAG: Rrf2 family transcriptional regulator [Alteromonadaceae bacterium]
MNIKRFTDYSLRVLIYLALKENELVTIKEVADNYQISKNHLMKVVQELNSKGFIVATRGNNGGIKLSRPPKEINIGELVRMTEQDSPLVECFGPDNQCVIAPACQLKNILNEALNSFFTSLEQYTLADILGGENQDELKVLLLLPDM